MITGTFWPLVLLHGVGNAVGHLFVTDDLTISAGRDFLGSVGTGLITISVVGLLGVVLNRWRTHTTLRAKSRHGPAAAGP